VTATPLTNTEALPGVAVRAAWFADVTNVGADVLVAPDVVGATVDVVVVAGAINVNKVFATFDCPPAVTTMLAIPALPVGVVQVIDVGDTTTTFVHAVPPTVTAEALVKFVPVIVTAVPPAVEPADGDTPVTVGDGPDPMLSPPTVPA
jgi:hypothetical protein